MDWERMIEKIKKCLALSNSVNENEAAAALGRAQRLMEKHGVSTADIELSSIGKETQFVSNTKMPPRYLFMLVTLINEAFGCRTVFESDADWDSYKTSAAFIGPGENPIIAAYAFDVLRRQLVLGRKRYLSTLKRLKRNTKTRRADFWAQAWIQAVASKVRKLALTPKEDALIEVWKESHYQDLVVSRARKAQKIGRGDDKAILEGFIAGSEVSLHRGVGASGEVKLIP